MDKKRLKDLITEIRNDYPSIKRIVFSYHGSGDSCDEFSLDEEGKEISGILPPEVMKELETLVDNVLEYHHGGWENNDGGYGDIIIDLTDLLNPTLTLDHNDYITNMENTVTEVDLAAGDGELANGTTN